MTTQQAGRRNRIAISDDTLHLIAGEVAPNDSSALCLGRRNMQFLLQMHGKVALIPVSSQLGKRRGKATVAPQSSQKKLWSAQLGRKTDMLALH
jgi:hypothetical protein